MENDEGGNGIRWVFASLASIAIHAIVLGVMFTPGCGSDTPAPEAPAAPQEAADAGDVLSADGNSAGADSSYIPPSALTPDSGPGRPAQRPGSTAASRPSSQTAERRPDASASIPDTYVVKQGDNLTKIARAYGTTAEAIAKANGKSLNAMNKLWVGQKIKLK